MKEVKVTFANGQIVQTRISGSEKEILDYYRIGKIFNIGVGENDNLQAVLFCDFV
jgi:hypothetical protein